MGFFNWVKENWITVTATVVTTVVTGGTNLIAMGIAAGAGYLLDADRKQREQEDKKLALVGKAGETISNEVKGLQNQRTDKISQLNTLEQQIQQKKNKLNDPNISEEEKAQIRSELASFVAQADKLKEEILDYDKKIDDLLKNIPGNDNKKGGLINLENMDPQTKLIVGAIIFLIIYFAFIKEKDN